MKTILSVFMITLFATFSQAQTNNYRDLWLKVEQFEEDDLPKSALKVVEEISALSRLDNNSPQFIKALLHKSKYALILEEDAQLKIINDFKSEIEQRHTPSKNVLENMLATLYWQYFKRNRYKFYNRSKTQDKVDTTDFRTWDLQTLFNEIHKHYQNSLENAAVLQQIKIEDFYAIVSTQENSKTYRPTLFDLLSHNALEFYKTDETSITKPAYKFEIDFPEALSNSSTFSKLQIQSQDTASLQLQALKIYQRLIKYHQKDPSPEALIDVDIERLKFVSYNSSLDNKEQLLLETLKASSDAWHTHAASASYDFEIASLWQQQGLRYTAQQNEANRWKAKDALELCKLVINTHPKSVGAQKCEHLKSQILESILNIRAEEFVPIQQYSRVRVEYKNLEQLKFSIYRITKSQVKAYARLYKPKDKLEFIAKLNADTQWGSTLKTEGDYQKHSTEISIPKLNNGLYLIVAKANNTLNTFASHVLQVTNLAIVEKSTRDKMIYQIIDRTDGSPVVGAKATMSYQTKYNGKYVTTVLSSDDNGEIQLEKIKQRYLNLSIALSYNSEKVHFKTFNVNTYRSWNDDEEKLTYKAFLFTDRSIYRPGQTLYFKGIAMQTENNSSEVLPNKDVKVTLYNANRELIKEYNLKTNAFGSIAGEFILPNNGLTGSYSIKFLTGSITNTTYFSVEEYKRPKFEVNFNPVTNTYKVNDSITVTGKALAFAGSSISNAKVMYKVHRKIQYPRWYYWYSPSQYSESQEITHGESLTDASGNFDISFMALPDQSVDKKNMPVFKYEISADITDVNGETRSSTTIINVGYHALNLTVFAESKLDKTKKDHTLKISSKNLNGQFVAAKGHIKIYKLIAPNQVVRPRPWPAPDYQIIPQDEFRSKFPHEAYNNEHDPKTWKKGELVFDKAFDTNASKDIQLGNIKKWESGLYSIILESKDKFGQAVKDEIKTTLYSNKDQSLADNKLFSITTNKKTYNVNDQVLVTIASAAKNITVTLDIEKDQKITKTHTVILNNSQKTISIPITSNEVGGFAIHYSFAAFNSFHGATKHIAVPYPKTDLEIETLSFRDKLQPGQDQTWSFKIKGKKANQISAELLASMYDASLDQFKSHKWNFTPVSYSTYRSYGRRNARQSFGTNNFRIENNHYSTQSLNPQVYDHFYWFGLNLGRSRHLMRRHKAQAMMAASMEAEMKEDNLERHQTEMNLDQQAPPAQDILIRGTNIEDSNIGLYIIDGTPTNQEAYNSLNPDDILEINILKGSEATALYGAKAAEGVIIITTKNAAKALSQVKLRKNLQETAFFFPQLQTDSTGLVNFKFTTPEALTKWKLQLLAHTKTLNHTVNTLEAVTQKELMVIPNTPRFLREGDQIRMSTKISNLTDKTLYGQATLELTDAISGEVITNTLLSKTSTKESLSPIKTFSVDAKGNTQVSWTLHIPSTVQAIQCKIIAKSGNFSDGEQHTLPVLSNRMLVTESLPMWVRSNETKTFSLDKLKTNNSASLKHHKLTLEITSNPAWYAVQALPYLMEFPYECNEQIFSRYYANALASHIAGSSPRIKAVFDQWRTQEALLSNLEKNQELKSLLIQETPWLRDAQSETEQKKRIALLFDLNKMRNELVTAQRKLKSNQMDNGAWSWFNGGRPNRFITQHIITGFGHLTHLNATDALDSSANQMIKKAIQYLDTEFIKEYKDLTKYSDDVDLSKDHLSYTQLHYLYMRSFFTDIETSTEVKEISNYYLSQIQKYWTKRSLYAKGLMALVTHRNKDSKTAAKILNALKENSITSDELGMYWKSNAASWFWHQAPIETQALLIEAFSEIENDTKTINNLKIWLLKNKQTNNWKTTKATTDAVYALLLQGSDWLSVTDMVDVVLGKQAITPSTLEQVKTEAGTGYYKTSWTAPEISKEMANVTLSKKGKGIAWGSLYWQYFEDLDKITPAKTPLQLKKRLFKKTNTDKGEVLTEVTPNSSLNVGDLVRVRIELRSDRDMEFIHMKDMRASGLEPINVLSKYKWQDGLGYYESTRDAATNFFFDRLPKGVYVFEYDLRVNNAGKMSNGITSIQSMYAPEYTSHSEGLRINID